MIFEGPILGLPRVSGIGPFAQKSRKERNKEEIEAIFAEIGAREEVNPKNLTEDQAREIASEVADRLYPNNSEVSRTKKGRLAKCLSNDWVQAWSQGMEGATGVELDDLERMKREFKGCSSLTENHTPSDSRLLP